MSTVTTSTLSALGNSQASSKVGEKANETQMNQFLTLLTAQLRNQDPMQPTDPTQFVAQLAQFTSVEQLVKSNSALTSMSKSLSGLALGQYSNMVNKTVTAPANAVTVPASGSVSAPLNFTVTDPSLSDPQVAIRNESGVIVRTIPAKGNTGSVTFDGNDAKGNRLPAGSYAVGLVGTSKAGGGSTLKQAGTMTATGVVTSVNQSASGDWMLQLKNGQEVPANAVQSAS